MSANPLLFMPFLHKELRPAALPSALLQLWPGLPDPHPGYHVPADFPLTPQDAAQYVEHVRSISIAAADNIPVHSLLAAQRQARRLGIFKETRDISAFAEGEEPETDAAYHLKEAKLGAQKFLLRLWLLEERHLEIQGIEQHCRTLSNDFTAALGVELEDEEEAALLLTQNLQRVDETIEPSLPWRLLLENAALFLPEHSTLLFTDSGICSELHETTISFTKTQAKLWIRGQAPPAQAPELGTAPLWQALDMKGSRPERPWLGKMFSFLLWNDAE